MKLKKVRITNYRSVEDSGAFETEDSVTCLVGKNEAGKKTVVKVCAACHGENGVSQVADFPKLAGQYPDYLVRVLKDYQSGARKNAIMAGQVANLTPQDIDDLAAYFSGQQALLTKY